MSAIFQAVLWEDVQVSDYLDKRSPPMLQCPFRWWDTQSSLQHPGRMLVPWTHPQTLSVWINGVSMGHHTAWLWFSVISTFLKAFWFQPLYMGMRDVETSEGLRTQRGTEWKPLGGVIKMPKHPFNLQTDLLMPTWGCSNKTEKNKKIKIIIFKNSCALLSSPCDFTNHVDSR